MGNTPAEQEDLRKMVRKLELQIRSLEDASKLQPVNDNYRDLLRNLPVGVILYDINFHVIYINQYVSTLFSFAEPEVPENFDLNLFSYILPEYHSMVRDRFNRLLKGENLDFFELKVKVPEERILDIQTKSSAIIFNGQPVIQAIFLDITISKHAENERKENDKRVSTILDSIDELVYLIEFNPDGSNKQIRYISSQISKFLGISPDEFISGSDKILSLCHPEDLPKIYETAEKLRKDKKTVEFIYRFKRKDSKEYIWLEERVLPQLNKEGQHIANLGIMRVVTDRINYESRLKESEEKFRMLAENAQDVIFKFCLFPPRYEYVSPSALELTGYTPEEFYADPYLSFKITHKGDAHIVGDSETVLRENKPVNGVINHSLVLRWVKKNGDIIWTETRNIPVFDDTGKMVAIEGISRDITQSKKDEEALRDSEERFRILSNASTEGIVLSDRGNVIDVNERFLDIFGFTRREEVLGKPVRDFVIRDSKRFVSSRISSAGPLSSFEIVCRKKDGSEIFLEARGQNIPYNGKKIRITSINDITQRKISEDALKESERTLSTLLGNLPGMAYRCLYDDKWTMQFVSDGCYELTGYKPEDLLRNKKLSFSKLLYPEDRPRGLDEIEQAIKKKTQFEIQYRIVTNEHKVKWVLEKGEGVFDEKGKLLFLEGFISDITEQKQHEIELEKSKESYKNLIESSPDGIFIHDYKGKVLFANPAVLKMLEINTPEKIGMKSIYEYSLSEDLEIYRKRSRDLFKGKDLPFVETKIRRKDGSVMEVESKPILFNYLGKPSVLVFCRDITFQRQLEKEQLRAQIAEEANRKLQLEIGQRQRTERELQSTQKYTRRLIDSSLDMIYAFDKEDYITEFNLSAQNIFLYSSEEAIGKPITFLFATPQQWSHVNDELVRGTGAYAGEVICRKKSGELFTSFLSASVLKNDFGESIGAMGVSRDISTLKKTEEQINLQAAKLNSIIESSSHYIWTYNRDLCLTSFNLNYVKMMFSRYGQQVKAGTHLFKGKLVSTAEHNDFWMIKSLAAFNGLPQNFETSFYHNDTGNTTWMEVYLNPIYGADNKVSEISGIGHDITEKKISEERLRLSLKEKEVLLKEVHHRVKNNLQVISSILNLQSSYVKDRKTLEILRESQNRIKSMAYIHESLYQTKDFSSINFAEYVTNLSTNLVHSYQSFEDQVELDLKIQDLYLNLDLAIPCGLIINEILSNALKYAFPKNRRGKISIRLAHKNQEITLVIQDNGIGLPDHIDYKNTESLGLQLVVTLVDQLGGTIKLDRLKGTKFTISFMNPIKNA
jgi:PAS domain S-box-containing protein